MRTIKKLRGSTYYIDSGLTDSDIVLQLADIKQKDIAELAVSMGVSNGAAFRLFMEKIMPGLAALAGLPPQAQYQDIVIAVLERAAEAAGVDKYEVYSFKEFIKALKKKASDGCCQT